MSQFEQKDNSGSIFSNNKKAENHPDFKGKFGRRRSRKNQDKSNRPRRAKRSIKARKRRRSNKSRRTKRNNRTTRVKSKRRTVYDELGF